MIAIKLQRIGKKHQPSYRVVVAPSKSKLGGPAIEDLGTYSTTTKKASLNKERVLYWVGVGAQPTTTVHNLLVKEKIVTTPTRAVKMKKKVVDPAAAAPVVATAPATAPVASAEPAPAAAEPEAPVVAESETPSVAEPEVPAEPAA